jgi:peptidyl-prolyl cis-trans isomerase B (cyclophilin B)
MKKAIIETEKGNIVLELFEKDAPKTVANFEKLIKQGFYDGLIIPQVTLISSSREMSKGEARWSGSLSMQTKAFPAMHGK